MSGLAVNLYIGTALVIFVLASASKEHQPVPTYFWSLDEDGKIIDRDDPNYNNEIENKPWINKISREDASTITLQALPESVKNGGKVTVLWKGVTDPQPNDFVAFYCPYYDDTHHYLDYVWTKSAAGWKNGSAHFEKTVYNMRSACVFKFYRAVKGNTAYLLAAVSNKIDFTDGGEYAPLQGHLSMANKATEMRVMWTSGEVRQTPVVRYGLNKHLLMKESAHLTYTYTKDSMCQSPANGNGFFHPGYIYDVLLTNLKPNTLYYYSYGTADYMSPVANFTTPIPRGDATPFKFVIYGDMGVDPYPQAITTAKNIRKEVEENKIRYVFHHGDISYARGYAYIWEQWFYLIEPYSTLIPYFVGMGNHEYDHTGGGDGRDPSIKGSVAGFRPKWWRSSTDSGGECGVPMYKRFHMPDNGNSLYWYSYDYGLVHMIMMSTEHNVTIGSPQYTWLENDLKNVDRSVTPWVFIGGHRAMYMSQIIPGDYQTSLHLQAEFEQLLYKHGVDIAFWAHNHSYERMCKIHNGVCVNDGVLHIIVGTAGKAKDPPKWYPKPWAIAHFSAYGYGRVTVANASAVLYEFVENDNNKVMDHVWLYK